jgi:hypothetical protein
VDGVIVGSDSKMSVVLGCRVRGVANVQFEGLRCRRMTDAAGDGVLGVVCGDSSRGA